MQKNISSHSSAIFRKSLDNLGNVRFNEGVGDEPTVNQNQETKQMKPLSFYHTSELANAVTTEFGEALAGLKDVFFEYAEFLRDNGEVEFRQFLSYILEVGQEKSSYQDFVATLILCEVDSTSGYDRMLEVLQEYS